MGLCLGLYCRRHPRRRRRCSRGCLNWGCGADGIAEHIYKAGRVASYLPPAAYRRGDVTATLYGYLVVHIVDAGTIGRGRRGPLTGARPRVVANSQDASATGWRDHLHGVGHLERSDEGHGPAPIVTVTTTAATRATSIGCHEAGGRGRGRRSCRCDHARLALHLGRLVWWEDWHAATHHRVVGGSRRRRVRLLRWTRRVGAVVIVRQRRTLWARTTLELNNNVSFN